jgi:hypothetical protein
MRERLVHLEKVQMKGYRIHGMAGSIGWHCWLAASMLAGLALTVCLSVIDHTSDWVDWHLGGCVAASP